MVTKEQAAKNWQKYYAANREALLEKQRLQRLANLDVYRAKNSERMRKAHILERERTKDARATAKAQRQLEAQQRKTERLANRPEKRKALREGNKLKFPNLPLTRGDLRKDGLVFWRYDLERVASRVEDLEVWMTQSEYEPKAQEDRRRAIKRFENNPGLNAKERKRFLAANPTYQRDYQRKRQATNPLFAIAHRCRSTIQSIIRRRGWKKICKTNEMLGCDWPTLKLHLESQFVKGMTWENRHRWHIDHFHPLGDAQTIEDVIRLNHYTNLRPLWKHLNLKKSSTIPTKGLQTNLLFK